MNKLIFSIIVLLFISCNNNNDEENIDNTTNPPPPLINYTVIKVYPHDTSSYTQGLIWYNNSLYEGTGRYGFSKLIKVNIEDGKDEKAVKIDTSEFGEGITILNDTIYQLTWKSNVVHVYDANTFRKIKDLKWNYEGWGVTNNGKQLIVSTGSSNLYFVNPGDFKIINIVGVNDNYGPVPNLNELEYIKGYIYANQYETNYILKINPETGKVDAKLDFTGLIEKSGKNIDPQHNDVLNGIAYDSAKNSMYITGKLWPALFEIKINQ